MIVDKMISKEKLVKSDYDEYNAHCIENKVCPLSYYIETKLKQKGKRSYNEKI